LAVVRQELYWPWQPSESEVEAVVVWAETEATAARRVKMV
jgi:hypothetical protein